ncbi:hypothetical protein B9Z55_021143 [Caenorhabditis nigoni]|uniref:Lin-15A/B-like domain-containing protein n=1 Tax=Caenorhabditis nigoni TaxID=1611254 RepID=A0A2G5TR99_9PELO|nr:hypothetical protein B9Z55_021143 [Caenorhabditis nigoni]
MNEAVIKEEVIEETYNFTFKNGEYVKVKQEEIEQKPEYLLEKEIKTEPIDFVENVKLKTKKFDCTVEKVSEEITERICEICWRSMPRNLLKSINSEDEKTVLSHNFQTAGSLDNISPYVCISHIQKIIDENDGKLEFASTPFEKRLLSFIKRNSDSKKNRAPLRRNCQVCHMSKQLSELYFISSKDIRVVLMVGCILRGTHSVEQAKSYTMIKRAFTCYSHCKESIDMIFEHFGVTNIEEFLNSSKLILGGLMYMAKKID